jgi:hypothetical protein
VRGLACHCPTEWCLSAACSTVCSSPVVLVGPQGTVFPWNAGTTRQVAWCYRGLVPGSLRAPADGSGTGEQAMHPLAQANGLSGPFSVKHRLPGWETAGQVAPGTASAQNREVCVEDAAQRMATRSAVATGLAQIVLQVLPLSIREAAGIGRIHADHWCHSCHHLAYKTRSKCNMPGASLTDSGVSLRSTAEALASTFRVGVALPGKRHASAGKTGELAVY